VDKLSKDNKKGVITKLFSPSKSSPKQGSKNGMLLHVFVGDAQLEAPPKDKQSMRLVLAGDVKQGGKDFSIASTWKEGALVSFKNTTVMGSAEDKAQATVSFTLKASPKSNPAEEETIGEAVLSTYAMESAVEKIVVLNPPSSSKNKAPVGRLSVTLFLNRFAIDFDADSHRQKNLLGGPSASSSSTLQARAPAKPSSREYSFLLNRKLNWRGERRSTFNKQTEVLLQEDMSKHMKELKRSLQAERGASAAAAAQRARSPRSKAKGKGREPKLAYGTQHAPPPPRAQSPTRKTNMGVGFIGASWPRPERAPRADEEERIASELKMAEERRLMNLKAIALDAKQRAMEARLKSEAAKMTVELQAREDDVMRRALQKQEEELARMRRSLEAQKRKGLNRAVQAHFLESEERRKLKEEVERREKAIFMQTLREAEGVAQPKESAAYLSSAAASAAASSLAPRSQQPHSSSTLKAANKRVGKPQPTAWMLKQRRRAERARRVRLALQEQFAGSSSVVVPTGPDLDASLRDIEQRRAQRSYMQPIHHVKLNPRVVGDVSVITSAVLAPPRPPSPPPTAARAPRALSPDKPPLPPVSAEEAAARALERYRAALQRKQEQSLSKVARSSLYGAAYGKTQSKAQQRAHSAPPPSSRPASIPVALTRHTAASLSRRESIGGKYSEFGSEVFPDKTQSTRWGGGGGKRGAAGADTDAASIDTETLVREMSREISSSSSGAGRLSRRSVSVPPSPAAAPKAASKSKPKSKPRPTAPGSPVWVAESKRAVASMSEKSRALKKAAAQFTLAFDEPQAQLLQPPPVPAPVPGVSSSASSIPGFLSSYVNVQAMEPPSYNGTKASSSSDSNSFKSSKSSKSSKAGLERIIADLAAKDTPTPEAEAAEQAHQQAREAQQLRELVASVETSKGAALEVHETRVLSEIASLAAAGKGRSKGKGKGKKAEEGPLSPSSNLRAALFGDGE
jgi:hypothetical protein